MEQAESTGWYTLPPEQQRGGVLGRAGFLALNATAVRSSPTHRGKFIRTRLLCQDIPPPPEGTVTSLDEVDQSLSLRDQLEQHMSDPACSSCHALMDPIGFPLEHFDALGTWRDTDNGHPIDATGTLDNIDVDGAAELGIAVSNHTRFGYCTTAQLMRHSIGVFEGTKQKPYIEELSQKFASSGFVFSELIVSLVLSDAFRYLSGPLDGNACSTEGEERPCASECSTGVETCIDSIWQNCSAAPVEQEICDGLDQDCNGVIDDLSRACHVDGRDGIQTCNIASWSGCETSVTDEVCDGIDNDADGAVDEGLSIRIEGLSLFDIQSQHENCDLDMNPISGPCNAAAHRYCAVQDCDGYTGFGPLIYDPLEEKASIACLDSSQAHILETTFNVLHEYLEYCVVDTPISANCNASINRFCNAQGLGTGFGPIEHSGENAWVVCTPNAEKLLVDYDELSALQEECFWPGNRYSLPCNTAIHTWCATQGYKTGFGPLENSDNHAWVACLPYPMEEQ
jgi:hypothetical protein